jgi:hypothetical protein
LCGSSFIEHKAGLISSKKEEDRLEIGWQKQRLPFSNPMLFSSNNPKPIPTKT